MGNCLLPLLLLCCANGRMNGNSCGCGNRPGYPNGGYPGGCGCGVNNGVPGTGNIGNGTCGCQDSDNARARVRLSDTIRFNTEDDGGCGCNDIRGVENRD